MDDIYTMKLHDTLNTEGNINITRVPGGWIYNYAMRNYTVMVPYNDEFNNVKYEREVQQAIHAAQMRAMYDVRIPLPSSLSQGV